MSHHCFNCGAATDSVVSQINGKKKPRISRYICNKKECWTAYYKLVDASKQ